MHKQQARRRKLCGGLLPSSAWAGFFMKREGIWMDPVQQSAGHFCTICDRSERDTFILKAYWSLQNSLWMARKALSNHHGQTTERYSQAQS